MRLILKWLAALYCPDRLAYDVYEGIFEDFFLAKDELKALALSYEGYLAGSKRLAEAN